MKKIYSLIATLMVTMTMSAQSLSFVDASGNEIKDGSTLVMNEADVDFFGDIKVHVKGIYIHNSSSNDINGSINFTIQQISNGYFECCSFNMQCVTGKKTGDKISKSTTFTANSNIEIDQTEWIAQSEGTCDVVATLSGGPSITFHFVYDPTNIKGVSENKNQNINTSNYNIVGQRVSENSKGIVIKDGKKIIVK